MDVERGKQRLIIRVGLIVVCIVEYLQDLIRGSQVDSFSFNNDDMIILFAAGNSGADGPGSVRANGNSRLL